MENKEYTARKIKSAFNKIEKSGKRVTTTNICKLLGHPPTSPMTRNVLSRSREITGNGKNKRERKGENPFPWK